MILPASYLNGFAPRDGQPLYPSLWTGCVGAWNPGLGPTGLVLRDQSGFSRHGTLTNGPTFAASGGKYAMSFDGVDDYATVSSLNLTGITENFTFITVIKFPTFNNSGVIVWQAFSSYWALMTNTSFGAANLTFTTRGTRGQAAVSSTLTANQWYYVVCKREAGVNSLYINNTISNFK